MTTSSRLLSLLSLLQTTREWPGAVLAERLGISHRTVRRDVDRLREMGYSIQATMGPDGGYRLDAGSELPPLLFDDDQVVAITVALQTAVLSGAGVEEAAARALTTVRQVTPPRLRHRVDAVQVAAIPPGTRGKASTPVTPDHLVALSAAVRAREVLRLDYEAPGSPASGAEPRPPRRVEPHHLVTSQGRWYLLAWDLDADDWRTFRADRITLRSPGGARFGPREVPGGDVVAFVQARFKGSDRAGTWPCTGQVVLHLPASEVLPYAGDGAVEDLGPDRCRFESGSWSWVSLAASLCRFDAELDVVGPPELADAFALLAARAASAAAR
ncbi:predicted transcriptional regulator [Sanguibacter keddieii DSM 10542]|uniref:Predicted transcriptional regulator n=1 Tax=Sanguibacter keddieii (strain ATCC 51767 / DSM 10542 / NCFB 3025 / ST-74) TaxID=446469 RepID=D1BJ12_SANKS|nr:WYL domain-containing protein [Sanguibacter keddieii]ACZ20204.1 predicted transcriptional regulator [Sanguibacter keddieii DSM 10542]